MQNHLPGTYLKLVLTTFFWGGTFVFAKTAGSALGEVEAATWRFLISALLLTPLLFRGSFPRPSWQEAGLFLILGLSGIYFYNLFFFHGLQLLESSLAGLIVAMNPIIVILLSTLFLKERLTWKMGVGILLSVTGAMVVVISREAQTGVSASVWPGVMLIFGCVFSWAIFSLIGKLMMRRYTPEQLIAVSVWIGAFLLVLHLLIRGDEIGLVRGRALFDVFYLAVLGTVLSFVWYYQAIDKLGAGLASQFVNLVPVFAVLFSYVMLGERLSLLMFFGGAMVILGVLITQRAKITDKANQAGV